MTLPRYRTALLLALLLPAACRSADDAAPPQESRAAYAPEIAPPLDIEGTCYDFAGQVELEAQEPEEGPGLHNVFHLSHSIVSGSEPHGDEAFEMLQRMGVKTIVSVDGKAPDVEEAAKYGIRYVHVPIQYRGISEDERLRLAKTFRELEGPFYVHCFHGKHRGPAGAAVGRIVLDGVPREKALAEMRQWSGTSSKYEGLYEVIAEGSMPSPEATAAYAFDFESQHRAQGLVGVMVALSRAHDNLALLSDRAWALDPEHPDIDALNEAEIIKDAFAQSVDLSEVKRGPQDLRDWFAESRDLSSRLVDELRAARGGDAGSGERAVQTFLALKADCSACHKAYRDH
ncbi:MAG: hypothetical protein H6828_08310 [Planctomycetes bacterium]|nr:hypothetical protein [Planctomycetota bacterium]